MHGIQTTYSTICYKQYKYTYELTIVNNHLTERCNIVFKWEIILFEETHRHQNYISTFQLHFIGYFSYFMIIVPTVFSIVYTSIDDYDNV